MSAPSPSLSAPPLTALRREVLEHCGRATCFREDRTLLAGLEPELDPVLESLYVALIPSEGPLAVHEAYAYLSLLCRRVGVLGATPAAALVLVHAITQALRSVGVRLLDEGAVALSIVAMEAYTQGHDERLTRELRRAAADTQVVVELARGVHGVFLAGVHDEPDLTPMLEQAARELLRDNAKSCLLDLSRLRVDDEDLARGIGRFIASAVTLGVATFVFGATPELQSRLSEWGLRDDGPLLFVHEYERAHTLALAAAGQQIRPIRGWLRRFAGLARVGSA